MLKKNQANLRKLMDAAKVSEQALDQHIKANKQEVIKYDSKIMTIVYLSSSASISAPA